MAAASATTPTRENVAAKFAQVAQIIDATTQAPTIVNDASQFVVVTYWWGRGRQNFNTARPCGDFYETLLDKPIHLLTPLTATPKKYRAAVLGNQKFLQEVDRRVKNYLNSVKGHVAAGKALSTLYVEKTPQQIRRLLLDVCVAYAEQVLEDIQEYQKLYVERADLEDNFKRRLAAGLTAPAQLETIRTRLQELAEAKEAIQKRMKSKVPPFKSQLDKALRYADPLTYDGMIANWEETCRRSGCNYLAVEYPQFAEPGGYQLAINAKPRFIQKALELCKGPSGSRGVLYIDGDMTVNRYPAIFDMPDVDLMARGWTVDPRSSYRFRESILVDPYTFETSGGTMFFGPTPEAALLLQRWIAVSEQYSQWGKADDRILSLVFNTYKLLLPLKIVQLPIEYLWLTLDYDDNLGDEDFMDRGAIYLEHPECLTSEDTAAGQGASSSRTPKFYEAVENYYPRSEYLHEAVMFPTAESTAAFRPYLNYLGEAAYFDDVEDEDLVGAPPFHVVPFSQGLGPYQAQADANAAMVATLPPVANVGANRGKLVLSVGEGEEAYIVPKILQALQAGYDIHYMPTTASEVYKQSLEITLQRFPRIEFAFVNHSPDMRDIFYFNSVLDVKEPVYFKAGCPHLLQLLSCCGSLSDLAKVFHDNYQFLSRIRTHFLKRYKQTAGSRRQPGSRRQRGGEDDVEDLGAASENALAFLYGAAGSQQGGKRRATRSKARKSTRRSTRRSRRTLKKRS